MNAARYTNIPGSDNSNAIEFKQVKEPAYATTIALQFTAEKTTIAPGTLTGAATITADVTNAYIADECTVHLKADGTNRTVTFGTGFSASATVVVVANKRAVVTFSFNGAKFIETGRFLES